MERQTDITSYIKNATNMHSVAVLFKQEVDEFVPFSTSAFLQDTLKGINSHAIGQVQSGGLTV